MAERAHPDEPGFRRQFHLCWVAGVIPFPVLKSNPYRDAFLWRYRYVQGHCRGKDVVDIPCGMGWGTAMLSGCKSLLGVDIAADAIAEAQRRYGSHCTFRKGDMARLDLPDASVDLVSCLEGIEHVPADIGESFIAECSRVLRDGGELIVSSPHCNDAPHSGNPYHFKEYQPGELRALISRRFSVLHEDMRIVDNLTVTMFHLRRK